MVMQVKEENIKLHGEQLGTVVSDKLQKNLSSEFKNLAVSIMNMLVSFSFFSGNQTLHVICKYATYHSILYYR